MNKYIWCEDSRAGFEFWKMMFEQLDSDIIVQSKNNNSELRKAVENVLEDDFCQYYILVDNAIDNPDVLREIMRLRKIAGQKKNVSIVSIHSFEFVLLSFKRLEQWIFASEDELRKSRKNVLWLKDVFVDAVTGKAENNNLAEIKDVSEYNGLHNTEQMAAKLLFDITRNTGFETDKSHLGACFVVDCCEWEKKQPDDICGLSKEYLSSREKMMLIYKESVLEDALRKAGLIYDYDL